MKDQLVSFETAKLAKKKGFDEYCYDIYRNNGTEEDSHYFFWKTVVDNAFIEEKRIARIKIYPNEDISSNACCAAPTQCLLQRWLREEHSLFISIEDSNGVLDKEHFRFQVSKLHKKHIYKTSQTAFNFEDKKDGSYNTYEEALEAALVQSLNLI
jgi:hypothetical protein